MTKPLTVRPLSGAHEVAADDWPKVRAWLKDQRFKYVLLWNEFQVRQAITFALGVSQDKDLSDDAVIPLAIQALGKRFETDVEETGEPPNDDVYIILQHMEDVATYLRWRAVNE